MSRENTSVFSSVDERGVAKVTLNRPDKHNAFDDKVIAELHSALEAIAQRGDVRVLILAAEGKSFSAGADLQWMQSMVDLDYESNLADARLLAAMLQRLNTMPMPVIARINGAAYGGAVGLVACCDIAVASERAIFSLSEVKLGLIPATVGPYVVKAIGERAARRYFLSGERISAQDALGIGLVSELVDEQALEEVVEKHVATLLNNSPAAVSAAKQLIADVADCPINADLIERTSKLIASIRVSEEGQEGLRAFLEKRKPHWL